MGWNHQVEIHKMADQERFSSIHFEFYTFGTWSPDRPTAYTAYFIWKRENTNLK